MTLIESTILGCVPLVSPVGSVGEIIRDGFNGVYVEPGDVDGMVSCLRDLDDETVRRMADNGIAFARENFTSEGVRDHLLRIVG
jgi:glycosyltransferase involved in cell wall biosynthesis